MTYRGYFFDLYTEYTFYTSMRIKGVFLFLYKSSDSLSSAVLNLAQFPLAVKTQNPRQMVFIVKISNEMRESGGGGLFLI